MARPTALAPLRTSVGTLLALFLALPLNASWWDVVKADASLDLVTAREHALAAVLSDPGSADAVAAASWWLENNSELPEPESLLAVAGTPCDPELAFVLNLLEADLTLLPPAAALATVEISGPFGALDVLDLERDVVPADADLPALGTAWQGPLQPFRLLLETRDGAAQVPRQMLVSGVYLAAWTFTVDQPVAGWLALEVQGGVNLAVDEHDVVELRYCGSESPGTSWYRVQFAAGAHRIRAAMASRRLPQLRVSLFDDAGAPLPTTADPELTGPWAESEVVAARPPAAAELAADLAKNPTDVPSLLLAASLAGLHQDPVAERQWLQRAAASDPDNPLTNLALANFFLFMQTNADAEVDFRRVGAYQRKCSDLPLAKLVERSLAVRQRRAEDAEQILDQLFADHAGDARVLQIWVREAVRRGWLREAEHGVEQLRALLPGSRRVTELRLSVLESLERWDERHRLLRALAASTPPEMGRVDLLASECSNSEAQAVLQQLRDRVDDPGLDISMIRLLLQAGSTDQARTELELAQHRWGFLPALDELSLVVAAGDEEAETSLLAAALERDPANLRLRSLAWQQGIEPFWAPFRVEAADYVDLDEAGLEGVDAILLLDQAVERVYSDGSSYYYYHGLTRAFTPAGARQASALQHLPGAILLTFRIIKPNGEVVIPDEMVAGQPNLMLDSVEAGDILEEEYVAAVNGVRSDRFGHISPYIYRFADAERAFGLSEYVILLPEGMDIAVEGNFTGLERKEWDQNGTRVLSWRAEQVQPIPSEPFSPPIQDLLPWVTYGFGVSWQDVGDALRDRTLPTLRGIPELWQFSEPLLTGDDPVAALNRLVVAICDEVEPGRSMLELRSTAGESFSRREGNRLGIVAAVLAHAGWQVDLVLGRTLDLAGTHLDVPSRETFFMPLLRVTKQEKTVWIDLEEERRGVDHIRPAYQGGDGLLLPLTRPRTPVTYLDTLPRFANPDLEERLAIGAAVDSSGNARVNLTMALRGGSAERMLQQVRSVPEDQRKGVFRQVAVGMMPGAEKVEGTINRVGDEVLVEVKMDVPGACEVAEEEMTCRSLAVARPLAGALASLPERTFELILNLPILQRFQLVLVPPPGWQLGRQARRLETRWGSVSETLEVTDGEIRSELVLTLPAQRVLPPEYPEFARFCHAVDELVSRPPKLVPGGAG